MTTFIDTLEETEVAALQDDLTPKQRANWEASIERDLQERAEGKPRKYISGDEFWEKEININNSLNDYKQIKSNNYGCIFNCFEFNSQ